MPYVTDAGVIMILSLLATSGQYSSPNNAISPERAASLFLARLARVHVIEASLVPHKSTTYYSFERACACSPPIEADISRLPGGTWRHTDESDFVVELINGTPQQTAKSANNWYWTTNSA